MNIPSLSARTIQRDIASSHFSIGANIQVSYVFCIDACICIFNINILILARNIG